MTCATFVAILTIKNRTWRIYLQPGATRDGTLALTMAIIGFVSLLLYGKGAQLIGDLGTSLGFAGYMSVSIIVANVLGFITGEWKGVGTRPIRWIIAATVVLVLSICVLGFGNSMWTGPAT